MEVQEIYTQNSLEEFYQLTDGYYPPKLPKYHRPVVNKPKTAPSTKTDHLDSSRVTSAKTVPLGKDYLAKTWVMGRVLEFVVLWRITFYPQVSVVMKWQVSQYFYFPIHLSKIVGYLNLFVCLSQKVVTCLISSEVLMIEHWYLACVLFVTSPFNSHHALTLTFGLPQGQICCHVGAGAQFNKFACHE